MSKRLIELLAELEYLRVLGQQVIQECDNVLRECRNINSQERLPEHPGSTERLDN